MRLSVGNMSCGHCKMTIEKALQDAGVSSYEVILEERLVTVDSDELSEAAVKALIQSKGYDVE